MKPNNNIVNTEALSNINFNKASYQAVFTVYAITNLDPAYRTDSYFGPVPGNNYILCSIARPPYTRYGPGQKDHAFGVIFQAGHNYIMVDPKPLFNWPVSYDDQLHYLEWHKRTKKKEASAQKEDIRTINGYPIGAFWTHSGVTAVRTEKKLYISRDFDKETLKFLGFEEREMWVPCRAGDAWLDISPEVRNLDPKDRIVYI